MKTLEYPEQVTDAKRRHMRGAQTASAETGADDGGDYAKDEKDDNCPVALVDNDNDFVRMRKCKGARG